MQHGGLCCIPYHAQTYLCSQSLRLCRQLREAEKARQQAQDALALAEQGQAGIVTTLAEAVAKQEASEQQAAQLASELLNYKVRLQAVPEQGQAGPTCMVAVTGLPAAKHRPS